VPPRVTGLLRKREADEISAVLPRSDGAREFHEDRCEPMLSVDIHAKFVVTTTEVLDKRVSSTDHPRRAQPFQATHRPQPGLQTTMIGFDSVIRGLVCRDLRRVQLIFCWGRARGHCCIDG
jgi:hypothetical protein